MLTELLKQAQNNPIPVGKQVVILYAGIYGYLDNIPIENIGNYERILFQWIDRYNIFHPYLENIGEIKNFDIKNNIIKDILENFKF